VTAVRFDRGAEFHGRAYFLVHVRQSATMEQVKPAPENRAPTCVLCQSRGTRRDIV